MKKTNSILVLVVTATLTAGAGIARAEEHHAEKPGHSHERCELHGGQVAMTRAHHFETVFAPDGVRIYMYSEKQDPWSLSGISGSVTLEDSTGARREITLVPDTLKKGEKVVYYCPMWDSPPQSAPGTCPNCGMALVPQAGLFGGADLSKARPGALKAIVQLTGLDGAEKEVTYTETFGLENAAMKTSGAHAHGSPKTMTPKHDH